MGITVVNDTEWAWESVSALGWVVGHSDIAILERLLRSPDTREDLLFLRSLEPLREQDLPDIPQYWEPHTELDYSVTFTDDQRDRLLTLLGETVHPKRLQKFDEQFVFNLQRAADEYGSYAPG